MVLLIAISVAAAAYASGGSGEAVHEDVDLEGKVPVELLPLERVLAVFEAPIATITYMEGDSTEAAEYLRQRVANIAHQNPWLGGWLAKDPKDGVVKLFYDETGEQLAPNLFREFEPGEIPLSRDTPFDKHIQVLADAPREFKVKSNAATIGHSDESLWRVSLIPDANQPSKRFALVASMSHMLGDGHTFFTIYHMLNKDNPISTLNPKRNPLFSTDVECMMGRQEAYYIHKIAQSPLWGLFQANDAIIETRVFFLNEEWVEGQKEAWTVTAAAIAAAETGQSKSSHATCGANYGVSFASPQSAPSLSTNDIVTCWFFCLVDATVGLMAYNFRGRLSTAKLEDAGNYHCAIPYTAEDFENPMLLQQSRLNARRAFADRKENPTTLPSHSRESKYAVSADWRSFQRQGGLDLGIEGSHQTLLMPLYDMNRIESLPKSWSSITLFNAGPRGEPAVAVIAPQAVMSQIESSGIVKEMLFENEGPSEDLFLENIQETKRGRRQSVFAKFVE